MDDNQLKRKPNGMRQRRRLKKSMRGRSNKRFREYWDGRNECRTGRDAKARKQGHKTNRKLDGMYVVWHTERKCLMASWIEWPLLLGHIQYSIHIPVTQGMLGHIVVVTIIINIISITAGYYLNYEYLFNKSEYYLLN